MPNLVEIFEENDIRPSSTCNVEAPTRPNSCVQTQIARTLEEPTGTIAMDSAMLPISAGRVRCPRQDGAELEPAYTSKTMSKFRLSLLEVSMIRIIPPVLLIYLLARISRELTQSTHLAMKLTGRNPIPAILDSIGKFNFFVC